MIQTALDGGFANAPHDAARAFRAIMTALARPGDIETVTGAQAPAPMSAGASVVVLTLCDPDTPLFLGATHDTAPIRDWIAFHTGAPIVADAADAMFVLGRWEDLPLDRCALGTPDYPDRAATLIVEVETLENAGATLSGPGIKGATALSLPERAAFQANARHFPRGLDFILTCGDRLAGVTRTTRVG